VDGRGEPGDAESKGTLKTLLEAVSKGPEAARVEKVEEQEFTGEFQTFEAVLPPGTGPVGAPSRRGMRPFSSLVRSGTERTSRACVCLPSVRTLHFSTFSAIRFLTAADRPHDAEQGGQDVLLEVRKGSS